MGGFKDMVDRAKREGIRKTSHILDFALPHPPEPINRRRKIPDSQMDMIQGHSQFSSWDMVIATPELDNVCSGQLSACGHAGPALSPAMNSGRRICDPTRWFGRT